MARDQLSPDGLQRCLRYVDERRHQRLLLEGLAVQDPLTGIANRYGFLGVLKARLEEEAEGLVLGHLDLDNFRHVNDSLGYQHGDQLINQVAVRVKELLDPGDTLARLGSDEFALLLDTQEDPARAGRMATRIVDALAEPFRVDGESLLLGCSLGLARAEHDIEADPLMWHAHIAMRRAKTQSGCTFHIYDEWLNRSERNLADLETELRRALRRDELELHYQPRLCMQTGQVVGLEALVRWRHAERGLLGPNEFIPLAEDTGLIIPLGYWVIDRALRDLRWLLDRDVAPLHMAINLSFRQFQDSKLLPTLGRLIDERGIDPRWIEFELTETAVMRRTEQVIKTMKALRGLGVRFSLDDFGTGYSSFVHLSALPIALLKVDRSFVGGMASHPENRRLVRAMINLAHNLDLTVVAEGVETRDELALLRQFGCDQAQGYLISKPLPLAELARFLVFGARRGNLLADESAGG
ncbi:GGDEF-domain containing protein [Pseudomonas matsuisoli]|uniref:GGDEF-domain containing protein n=1 Tax=Pseudomonas matsuisoli TaxID=1515666 RepID=A0A917Q0T2_9PSED|nr:GGDEF-domain containing protein [Pseudomonas matsuisoli]